MSHISIDSSEFARTANPSPELLYLDQGGKYRFPTFIESAINDLFTSDAVAHLVTAGSSDSGLVVDRLTDGNNRVLVERTRTVTDEADVTIYMGSVISWFALSKSAENTDVIESNATGDLNRVVTLPTESKAYQLQAEDKATLKQQLGAIARTNQ